MRLAGFILLITVLGCRASPTLNGSYLSERETRLMNPKIVKKTRLITFTDSTVQIASLGNTINYRVRSNHCEKGSCKLALERAHLKLTFYKRSGDLDMSVDLNNSNYPEVIFWRFINIQPIE